VSDDNFDDYVDDDSVHEDSDTDTRVPPPATWARPEPTGVASVDAAIDELAQLDGLPTSEHAAVYDGLHRQLQDALADLDGA
jgi:hypothetical protein